MATDSPFGKTTAVGDHVARSCQQSKPACINTVSIHVTWLQFGKCCLQLVLVPTNRERKTRFYNRMIRVIAGVFQRARREERVVGGVEGNGAEFLPVPNHGLFCENLMQGDFSLVNLLAECLWV